MTKTIHKTVVPKLRFSEFEGEWVRKKVGSLGDFKGGGTPSTENSDFWEGEIPWISSSDVYQDDVVNLNITRFLTQKAISDSATKIIPKDSVLFVSRVGVGKLAVSKEELCTSQDFANLIPKKDNSYYIAYYFIAKNKLLHQYSQGTSIKGFTNGDLKNIPINIPPLPEQQKIATFLSAVDTKIQQLSKKAALLEQYKKGVMQRLFHSAGSGQVSGQLRFKDDNGNAYPDWEEKRLGDVAEIVGGGTPETVKPEYWDGEIQWFTPTEIRSKYISNSKRTITQSGLKKSSAKLLPAGTILFTSRATIAELGFATQECTTNQGFQSLIVNEKNNSEFIYHLIKINKNEFVRKSQGSTFLEISSKEMKKMKFEVPIIEEQQKIASYLSNIDTKIERVTSARSATEQFKKGLLQQLFV